ncbi:hypothetical protein AMECASPLE_019015 [Ameca splendens]|uniref:Uncharacterized protein n=1 Tax=Ameca splendens TaxID=208324 RepID=A0ABV0XRS4_9TELE
MHQTISEPTTLTSDAGRENRPSFACYAGREKILFMLSHLRTANCRRGFVSEKNLHTAMRVRMDASSMNLVVLKVKWCLSAHNIKVQASKYTFELNATVTAVTLTFFILFFWYMY